jgi:hypothetical protein
LYRGIFFFQELFFLKLRGFTMSFSAASPCEAKSRHLLLQPDRAVCQIIRKKIMGGLVKNYQRAA